jgi:molybdate transport system substrate-binding protein
MGTPQRALKILSGGAAAGLVERLRTPFRTATGLEIEGHFDAVGAMKARLDAGEDCDLVILTQALVQGLAASGQVEPGWLDVGRVPTGVAVKLGANLPGGVPGVQTPDELAAALRAARGIYFPDPVKATAGIHFMQVMRQLGVAERTTAQHRPFPNGSTAMAQMAACPEPDLIGCTQVTEILNTPGVRLWGLLPQPLGLATVYTAGVTLRTAAPVAARVLAAMLAAPEHAAVRQQCGFDAMG